MWRQRTLLLLLLLVCIQCLILRGTVVRCLKIHTSTRVRRRARADQSRELSADTTSVKSVLYQCVYLCNWFECLNGESVRPSLRRIHTYTQNHTSTITYALRCGTTRLVSGKSCCQPAEKKNPSSVHNGAHQTASQPPASWSEQGLERAHLYIQFS